MLIDECLLLTNCYIIHIFAVTENLNEKPSMTLLNEILTQKIMNALNLISFRSLKSGSIAFFSFGCDLQH